MSVVMHKKVLNVCGELSEKRLSGQVFKDIIDGSERPAQYKNQQVFQMVPELTHWFASNHLPKSDDTSSGFIRRWLMLTFHYPVRDKDLVLDLGDRISSEEREAITSWATLAMPRLKKSCAYTLPPSHKLLCSEFANVNNSVRQFLTDSYKVHFGVENGQVNELKAFNAYWAWASAAGGTRPVSLPKFRAMMRELTGEFDFEIAVTQSAAGGTDAIFHKMTVTA